MTRILTFLGLFAFPVSIFSAAPVATNDKVKEGISGSERAAALSASKDTTVLHDFGVRIAGTYIVARASGNAPPATGPSRILNIFADGNLTSVQSTEVGGAAIGGDSFSNQHGTWQRVGKREIKATVLDLTYQASGEYVGAVVADYHLKFDSTLQTVTGDVEGKIFSPGIDPLNPGETQPIAEFIDHFQAQRVTLGN